MVRKSYAELGLGQLGLGRRNGRSVCKRARRARKIWKKTGARRAERL